MDEVKMALDVPTVVALCEQHAADDEWQMWYGRHAEHDQSVLFSGIIDHTYNDNSGITDQRGEDDAHY